LGALALVFLIMPSVTLAVSASATVSAEVGLETRTEYATVGESFVLTSAVITNDSTGSSYSWKQVSGSSEFSYEAKDGSTVSIVPQAAGTYVFELIATNATGASSVVDRVSVNAVATNAGTSAGVERDVPSGKASGITTDESGSSETVQHNETDVDFVAKNNTDADSDNNDSMMNDGDADDNEHGNDVSVRAVEVRGWDATQKSEFLLKVKTHAEVASGKDLENFARGVLLKDENIGSVAIDEEGVQIAYKVQGKLFGFIPHAFTEVITVKASDSAEERVKVRFPWYRFLLSIDASAKDIEALLNKDLTDNNVEFNPLATAGTSIETNSEADLSALAKALETISNVLKTKHDTVKNSINNVR